MEKHTYAIAGSRPTQFHFKYNERQVSCKKMKEQLTNQIILLYGQGIRSFYVKGALGVDLWAGEILIRLSDRPEFTELEVSLILPCEGYAHEWDNRSRDRAEALRSRCKSVTILGSSEWPLLECYRKCGKYIIDQADGLLAVCDPYHLKSGDMATMIKRAKSKNIPITCILPNSSEVILLNSDT